MKNTQYNVTLFYFTILKMSKRRTVEERIAMVRLFSKFENAHELRRQWKHHFDTNAPDVTTVLSLNKKFDETGAVEDLPRSGPPSSVLSDEKLEEIEKLVIRSPRLSVRQGAAQVGLSKTTYHRAMESLNFKPYRPTLIVQLNEDDFNCRSEFCETWLDKFENDSDLVDRIFWSDEAKFSMNSTVNRHNCTYYGPEKIHIRTMILLMVHYTKRC